MESGARLLSAAGVDLRICAQNLRKLDKTRMLGRSLERTVRRQKSFALKLICDAKTQKTRALEDVSSRVKE